MSLLDCWKISRVQAIGAIVLTLMGCGGPDNIGRVSGTVTLNGEPLEGAVVEFQPKAGNSTSKGITNSSGEYSLTYSREIQGAEVGDHRVVITTFSVGNPDADPPRKGSPEKLPANYNTKSELTAKVESGSNTIDFTLKSDGPVKQPKIAE